MNLFNYVEDIGKYKFREHPFTEIDSMVFSLLTYLDYTGIVFNNKKSIKLNEVGRVYLNKFSFDDVKDIGNAQRDGYLLLSSIINLNRYKDIDVFGYTYILDSDTQFSAISFKLDDGFKVIAFEGTDKALSGWKEDFYLCSIFPVNAQNLSIKYVNRYVSIFDKVILVGHSKGGNLALTAGMYINPLIRNSVKKIYSLDGPGLRKSEAYSNKYKRIKDKYIHIIPSYSMVGILLESDKYKVVKSVKKDISCHSLSTWIVENNKLVECNQSNISCLIEEKLKFLINNIDSDKFTHLIEEFFKAMEVEGVKTFKDMLDFKITFRVINNLNNIDNDTKKLIIEIIELMIKRDKID